MQKVRLRAELQRGDARTRTHAGFNLPPVGAKSTAAHKGSYQGLRETFQQVGPADLCKVLLFLRRVMGLAKMKATVGMIKASKHNPWSQYVFLRTESVTVPRLEISLKLAAVPHVEELQNQAQIPWSPGVLHAARPAEEHRETTQQGKEPMCKKPKKQFSNSIQLKVKRP